MSNRCPDCGIFVSKELEIEVNELTLSDAAVEIDARMALCCVECGTEMSEAEVQDSIDLPRPFCSCEEPDLELDEDTEPEPDDWYQLVDRHGKPIKNPRYRRHYYGFSLCAAVTCKKCGAEREIEGERLGEIQASDFDPLY